LGDNLRRLGEHTEITERTTDVDKWKVADILVHMLGRAFTLAELPKVRLGRFPQGARSVFIFRVDVDGTFGDHLRQLRDASLEFGIPTAFFLNRSLCEGDEELLTTLRAPLEVGNHGEVHNLFDDLESNLTNVRRCEEWLDAIGLEHGPWYAAPRGMWNFALAAALDELGFEFSSDFGVDTDGLPFFPRLGGKRLNALQLPVHAYSPERARRFAQENGLPEPGPEDVLEYFKEVAEDKIERSLPVYFYAHPEVFGPMASAVLGELAALAREKGIPILSLSEYAAFWRRRDRVKFAATLNRTKNVVTVSSSLPKDVRLVVNDAVIEAEAKEIHLGRNESQILS
jgi:peptidoglycan/xylan/chitin deacetylase (PgdA/CDA1 family)